MKYEKKKLHYKKFMNKRQKNQSLMEGNFVFDQSETEIISSMILSSQIFWNKKKFVLELETKFPVSN